MKESPAMDKVHGQFSWLSFSGNRFGKDNRRPFDGKAISAEINDFIPMNFTPFIFGKRNTSAKKERYESSNRHTLHLKTKRPLSFPGRYAVEGLTQTYESSELAQKDCDGSFSECPGRGSQVVSVARTFLSQGVTRFFTAEKRLTRPGGERPSLLAGVKAKKSRVLMGNL